MTSTRKRAATAVALGAVAFGGLLAVDVAQRPTKPMDCSIDLTTFGRDTDFGDGTGGLDHPNGVAPRYPLDDDGTGRYDTAFQELVEQARKQERERESAELGAEIERQTAEKLAAGCPSISGTYI